jgi:predicted house-cleaning noncanonical NTP pyrophosphatase (MazG superfamily)
MKPKKLIRNNVVAKLQEGEFEQITDLVELNKLYALKIGEELAEIQRADHKDVSEFADLIEVAIAFAGQNGITMEQLFMTISGKVTAKGRYTNWVLTNMNPENPSNEIYFKTQE